MKVGLINPGRLKKWAGCEPLNLGYLASYLIREGHTVRIFDELVDEDVMGGIRAFRPDVVGITAVTPLAVDAYRFLKQLEALGVPTVMGGVHTKFLPEEVLEHGADMAVTGQGEITFAKILDAGIEKGKVLEGELPKNLDDLPPPARHLFSPVYLKTPDFVPNYLFVPKGVNSVRAITSRGCAYRCSFCHNSLGKKRILFHSPERVVDEVEQVIKDYDVRHIFYMDDDFLLHTKRVKELCARILQRNVKFSWAIQATSNEIKEDLLPDLRRAGCEQMVFGFESGSQPILDGLQKRTTVEKNEWALRKCKEAGFLTQSYVLIGNPEESVEDLEATKRFFQRNARYIDSLLVSFVQPFPGTQLWKDLRARGAIPEARDIDWSQVRYDTPSFPVNETTPVPVMRRYYFEMLAIKPPRLSTLVARFVSDPVGVMANLARTDKRAVARTLKSSLRLSTARLLSSA